MNFEQPIVFVSGLSRCGTSLTMQMLQAGGLPCAGNWPSFEPPETTGHAQADNMFDLVWLNGQRGQAMKWLDPYRWAPLPSSVPFVVIWLTRNAKQQAKSQAKFASLVGGLPPATRQHLRRWEKGLPAAEKKSMTVFGSRPKLSIQFELLVAHPWTAAELIAAFLNPFIGALDTRAMGGCALRRSSDCQPGVDIELGLANIADAAKGSRH